ncbi:hypothetical protein SEVIR_2G388566v4 [Setaria viridis]|uniref:Uncharacterized protein n=1 Tax=Setaria viridis TaxID=4556 RepID=A0A4U6W2T7_SETVI|nr:hypothetical protein SEVIR_2G388566v2 [Setaria viridis]
MHTQHAGRVNPKPQASLHQKPRREELIIARWIIRLGHAREALVAVGVVEPGEERPATACCRRRRREHGDVARSQADSFAYRAPSAPGPHLPAAPSAGAEDIHPRGHDAWRRGPRVLRARPDSRATRVWRIARRPPDRDAGVRSGIYGRDGIPRFRRGGRRRTAGSRSGSRPGVYMQKLGS